MEVDKLYEAIENAAFSQLSLAIQITNLQGMGSTALSATFIERSGAEGPPMEPETVKMVWEGQEIVITLYEEGLG